jgi:hypothetical protein
MNVEYKNSVCASVQDTGNIGLQKQIGPIAKEDGEKKAKKKIPVLTTHHPAPNRTKDFLLTSKQS